MYTFFIYTLKIMQICVNLTKREHKVLAKKLCSFLNIIKFKLSIFLCSYYKTNKKIFKKTLRKNNKE